MNVCQILNLIYFFGKFEQTTHTQSTRKRIDIDFERISIVYALARLAKIENVWFCSDALAMRFKFAIRGISFFQVKFNMEFTRHAVNFSIKL